MRSGLVACIRGEPEDLGLSSEQFARILDALRAGEESVRSGLSDKANFEVALFRGVEAGRSRAIDSVIREISGMVATPKSKKKTESVASLLQMSPPSVEGTETEPESDPKVDSKLKTESETKTLYSSNSIEIMSEVVLDAEGGKSSPPVDMVREEQESIDLSSASAASVPIYDESEGGESKLPDSQVRDEGKIAERVETLSKDTRKILEEGFRGTYVAIERIDHDKLI